MNFSAPQSSLPVGEPSPAPRLSSANHLLSQTHRDWMMIQAYLHLEQGKCASACQLLRILQRLLPEDGDVLRCLALAELLSGRPAEAARVATRALQKTSDSLRTPVGLVFAKALWEQGKQDSAREFLASLLTPAS